MTELSTPKRNQLLANLPKDAYDRISPHLEWVLLTKGEVLYESWSELKYVYFPITCIVSLSCETSNGESLEIAMVSKQGLVGISLFTDNGFIQNRAVVRNAGYAYRLSKFPFCLEFSYHGALLHLLLRYTQVLITQISLTAVCNRHHTIQQQLCRLLLLSLDQLNLNQIRMSQEIIALTLGVSPGSIAAAVKKLQQAELIDYHIGFIRVLNRRGMEKEVCECYQIIKQETDRLLLP